MVSCPIQNYPWIGPRACPISLVTTLPAQLYNVYMLEEPVLRSFELSQDPCLDERYHATDVSCHVGWYAFRNKFLGLIQTQLVRLVVWNSENFPPKLCPVNSMTHFVCY